MGFHSFQPDISTCWSGYLVCDALSHHHLRFQNVPAFSWDEKSQRNLVTLVVYQSAPWHLVVAILEVARNQEGTVAGRGSPKMLFLGTNGTIGIGFARLVYSFYVVQSMGTVINTHNTEVMFSTAEIVFSRFLEITLISCPK